MAGSAPPPACRPIWTSVPAGIVQVMPQLEPFTIPVWLATHAELHTSRRIRLVFDFLAEMLG